MLDTPAGNSLRKSYQQAQRILLLQSEVRQLRQFVCKAADNPFAAYSIKKEADRLRALASAEAPNV